MTQKLTFYRLVKRIRHNILPFVVNMKLRCEKNIDILSCRYFIFHSRVLGAKRSELFVISHQPAGFVGAFFRESGSRVSRWTTTNRFIGRRGPCVKNQDSGDDRRADMPRVLGFFLRMQTGRHRGGFRAKRASASDPRLPRGVHINAPRTRIPLS